VLFPLTAGGALFGLVGLILAVSVAATAGVILSFTIRQHRDSQYYEA
jgi:predicted PurR-regulated permease PerM